MTPRALLLFTILISISVNAEEASRIDCAKAFSTPDVEQCIAIELDKTETSLNQAYQGLVKQLTQA
ncbi:hypothetical protein, partial [Pseudomonas sp. EA_35y_Pfl2_R5]|uniref:hypothetical protein n=1 Tax=Pseudomonas sp. EA_35y_Pfl2_R5 TaxID=3088690 RepID=UPI0030DA0A09